MADSVPACALLCLESDQCQSFSVSKDLPSACYLNTYLLDNAGCVDVQRNHYNVKTDSPCLNGGTYNSTTSTCRCYHGFIGHYCERLMYDCTEGSQSPHYTDQKGLFYILPPTASSPFKVMCNMKYGGKVYLMRKDATYPYVDFNRTWEEYRDGFGDLTLDGNFWLGNEKIFLISTYRDMKLNIQMYHNSDFYQHFYKQFKVLNESSGYKASYIHHFGNSKHNFTHYLDNCMKDQNEMLFTSIDRDNDLKNGENCAQIRLSGWWYNECGGCNPTGKLQNRSDIYQDSDPIYMSVPVPGNWTPTLMELSLK
ncbi:fibrinogen-like protein 1 [Haliotis rubra]|uniref:fibrinogen-like protein 1 n=1 Tax=Haliotis rubra TaxID=36100 RepID=UPI001EE59E81|nr:fibrinogen-like protein 1 [Haliotis rubra]